MYMCHFNHLVLKFEADGFDTKINTESQTRQAYDFIYDFSAI